MRTKTDAPGTKQQVSPLPIPLPVVDARSERASVRLVLEPEAMTPHSNGPRLTAFDLKVLDVAESRTIDGIAYVIGRNRGNATPARTMRAVSKLRKAGLVAAVDGTYPVEFVTTDAGLRAIGDSLR